MRLGVEAYLDEEKRRNILLRVNAARSKEARVSEVTTAIPSWAERPFKEDQEKFNLALKIYRENDPTVRALEMRLLQQPGPVWKDITPQEEQALANWMAAIDTMHAYVNTYFPSEIQKFWGQVALGAIALGSFLAPLFLSKDDEGLKLPFSLEPLPLPWVSKRTPRGPRREPPAPTGATAIPVRAEVFRPGISPTWKRIAERTADAASRIPGASPGATLSPSFRSFVRPLGPSVPVTPATVRAAASTGTVPMGPASPIHGRPRFRKE